MIGLQLSRAGERAAALIGLSARNLSDSQTAFKFLSSKWNGNGDEDQQKRTGNERK